MKLPDRKSSSIKREKDLIEAKFIFDTYWKIPNCAIHGSFHYGGYRGYHQTFYWDVDRVRQLPQQSSLPKLPGGTIGFSLRDQCWSP